MRSTLVAVSLFTIPALACGVSLAAQAVERADVAGHGRLRVTFDPRIVGWDAQFVNGARLPLGLPLTGGTARAAALPLPARLAQDGRVASRECAAQAFLDSARGVRTALYEMVHGAGQTGSPFMPLDSSDGGRGIVQVVSYLQTRDSAAFNVPGFRDSFLLAHDTLSADLVAGAIVDSAYGFGYRGLPYRNSLRLRLGDLEVAAKYRLAASAHYAAALVGLLRLPRRP